MKNTLFFTFSFLSLFLFSSCKKDHSMMVGTLAGNYNTASSNDGQGIAASFNIPESVAVDAAGNIYVADAGNHRIRKISPSGSVSTLAGSGQVGNNDGQGSAASFNSPLGIAIDRGGTLYVADYGNMSVRKISPTGLVSTFSSGQVITPVSIAVGGPNGDVFVVSSGLQQILRLSAQGVATLFAGSDKGYADGVGAAAKFSFPNGVAVDDNGNVYVSDTNNGRIRKITAAGLVSTIAGNGDAGSVDGQGTVASLNYPKNLAVDHSGNIFIADWGGNKIRKITPGGIVTTYAGDGSQGHNDGIPTAATFFNPSGVAIDVNGNIYVADTGNNEIRKISN